MYIQRKLYLLTLLAFLFHQVSELCDTAFQACRKKAGSKRSLWEKFRTFITMAVFASWEQILRYFLNHDGYNIINGYVVDREPP